MNANDAILYTIISLSTIFAMINVWNYKSYKLLKKENELLKFKLKECHERAGTQ